MIFDIALNIRSSTTCSNSYYSTIKVGQYLVISLTSVGFTLFVILMIISAHKPENHGDAFWDKHDLLGDIFGYGFLLMFITMFSVNIFLILAINSKQKSFEQRN